MSIVDDAGGTFNNLRLVIAKQSSYGYNMKKTEVKAIKISQILNSCKSLYVFTVKY